MSLADVPCSLPPQPRAAPDGPFPADPTSSRFQPMWKFAACNCPGVTPAKSRKLPLPNDSSVPPQPSLFNADNTIAGSVNPPRPPVKSTTPFGSDANPDMTAWPMVGPIERFNPVE